MIALIDYGAGNVRSVHKALETVGAEVRLTRSSDVILTADKIVLPGVGAFGDCMAGLRRAGLVDALYRAVEQGKPLLGICVGMQVLFEEGEENGAASLPSEPMGRHTGLGLLPGRVIRFDFSHLPTMKREAQALQRRPKRPPPAEGLRLKIPHTGWNQIEPVRPSPLLHGLSRAWSRFATHHKGFWTYFNHAYYCQARAEHTLAVTDYGGPFASAVGRESVYGVQFHPEKSQEAGLHILRNFVERVR